MNYKRITILAAAAALVVAIFTGAILLAASAAPGASGYKVIKTVPISGEGSWDYVYVDSDARRVYVSHATQVVVLDADSYEVVGSILDTQGVHGIAIASDLGRKRWRCRERLACPGYCQRLRTNPRPARQPGWRERRRRGGRRCRHRRSPSCLHR